MKHLKKLTLLHSNDMHGDFMAKEVDDRLIGGVSMLSGYVGKVRREERNVVYSISGDMFRGSLIDSEYKGLSTVEIMNILAPDVVTRQPRGGLRHSASFIYRALRKVPDNQCEYISEK